MRALPVLTMTLVLLLVPTLGATAARSQTSTTPSAKLPYGELLSPLGRALESSPLSAPALGHAIAAQQAAAPFSLARAVEIARQQGLGDASPPPLAPAPRPLAAALADAALRAGAPLTPSAKLDLATRLASLDAHVASALAVLVDGESRAEAARGIDPFARLTPHDLFVLASAAHAGKPFDAASTGERALLGPSQPTQLMDTEKALADVDVAALWASHAQFAAAVDEAVALLKQAPSTTTTGILFEQGTPYGDIIVYGDGADTHTRDAFVEIDLGGNDQYQNHAGASRADILALAGAALPPAPTSPDFVPWAQTTLALIHSAHNASVSIDLAGDDVYAAPPTGRADGFGGFGGFGALIDLGGNDTYTGANFVQGAGQVAGAGFLVDASGADHYTATQQAQAYSQDAGGGFLLDGAGDDVYDAQILAQGTGYNANVMALLADAGGNDRYTCAGIANFADSILPVSAPRPGSTCHATGFGGTGVLLDGQGDDLYKTASSFQAMSLIGAGLLVDGGGNDQFIAGEWSNGVGVLGGAAIVEGAGDTTYSSVSTVGPWADIFVGSNGEGYLGAGVLADASGNDTYFASSQQGLWLPQYACSEGCSYIGGTGVLLDGAGNDSYTSEVGQGGAFIGTSVLVDAGGDDHYVLVNGGTRGQAYVETNPLIYVIVPVQPSSCQDALLIDAAGSDSYSNPIVNFGHRGDDAYWGQNDYARGMDGHAGIIGYATSAQFRADAQKLVETRDCEQLTPVLRALLCQFAIVCV